MAAIVKYVRVRRYVSDRTHAIERGLPTYSTRLRLGHIAPDPRVHCLPFRRQTARDVTAKNRERRRVGVREREEMRERERERERERTGRMCVLADTFHR